LDHKAKRDFPFYNGQPLEISIGGWLIVVLSVVVAFAILITLPFATFPLSLIPAVVYTGLPLVTIAVGTGGRHTALFGPVGLRELGLAVGFGFLTVIISMVTALALIQFVPMSANPTASGLAEATSLDVLAFLLRTGIQLVGEELMTILPLLAVLWLCFRHLKLSRTVALVTAVIVSTLWFGAVHLPTYNWNFVQALGGIGTARLVLTAAYLLTRNLWVSAGAHIVNDWFELLLPLALPGGHTPIGTQ
jgi:uncharacterized protein